MTECHPVQLLQSSVIEQDGIPSSPFQQRPFPTYTSYNTHRWFKGLDAPVLDRSTVADIIDLAFLVYASTLRKVGTHTQDRQCCFDLAITCNDCTTVTVTTEPLTIS